MILEILHATLLPATVLIVGYKIVACVKKYTNTHSIRWISEEGAIISKRHQA